MLREAIRRLPIFRAALTDKLAVVLYLNGKKKEALRELEGVRGKARIEMLPASKSAIYRLGALYEEFGRKSEARAAYAEFLEMTDHINERFIIMDRSAATDALKRVR
jgi:predicted negative regulator of RcsB-dependent stress response